MLAARTGGARPCLLQGKGRAFRAPGELVIELPGYYDRLVLDKFVPFSGTEWLTIANRFIRQPGRRLIHCDDERIRGVPAVAARLLIPVSCHHPRRTGP
jgi:hypothetical protein